MIEWHGYVICDLDGCLTDDRWRRKLLPRSERAKMRGDIAFKKYHALCGDDAVVEDVMRDVHRAILDEENKQRGLVLFVTARPDNDDVRRKTLEWIEWHFNGHIRFELLMRPIDSTVSSPGLKMALINEYFRGIYLDPCAGWSKVICAFDDRQDVLAAYPIINVLKQLRILPPLPRKRLIRGRA